MHQTEMAENGLSQVEERVLVELAAAGAAASFVWVGKPLSDEEVLQQVKSA
jgi:hypothetical protein